MAEEHKRHTGSDLTEATAETAGILTGSMRVRRASEADFDVIMAIFERARELMRRTGNPNQWGKSWPPAELIHEDIRGGNGMLLVDAEGEGGAERILAYFAMFLGVEPTYAHLTEGAWLDDDEYATMHRLASSGLKGHSGERACNGRRRHTKTYAATPTRTTRRCSTSLRNRDIGVAESLRSATWAIAATRALCTSVTIGEAALKAIAELSDMLYMLCQRS